MFNDNQRLSNQLALAASSQSLSRNQMDELLRLRGEVQSLREQVRLLSEGQPQNGRSAQTATASNLPVVLQSPTVPLTPAAQWTNAGNATPESALQTVYWAIANHDTNAFSRSFAWEPSAQTNAQALFDAAPAAVRQAFGSADGVVYTLLAGISPMSGFAVVSDNLSGQDAAVVEQHQYVDGRVRQNLLTMRHFDDGWRLMLGDEKFMRGFDALLKRAANSGD